MATTILKILLLTGPNVIWGQSPFYKIEEFASILDDVVDTTALEKVPFVQRIPLGMYAFTYLEENGMDISYQVMVYDSTAEAYRSLMDALPRCSRAITPPEEYLRTEC